MRTLKSNLFWQFSSGFVLGTMALVALQPSEARHALVGNVESALPIHPSVTIRAYGTNCPI